MAALTGDIYSMMAQSQQAGDKIPDIKVNQPSRKTDMEEPKAVQDNPMPELSGAANIEPSGIDSDVDIEQGQETDGHYHGEDSQEVDDAVSMALKQFRLWRGGDFLFSDMEAKAIRSIARSSDDPFDAVSRYAAASGLASMYKGLSVREAYDSLDQISEFFTGTSYESKHVSMWQKIKNGFEWVDIMKDKMEWKRLYLEGKTEAADDLKQKIQDREARLGDKRSAIPTSWLDEQSTYLLENLGYIAVPSMKGAESAMIVMMAGSPIVKAATAANPIAGAATAATLGSFSAAVGAARSAVEMKDLAEGETFWNLMNNYEKKNVLSANLISAGVGLITGLLETFMDGVTSRAVGSLTSAIAGKRASVIGANMLLDLTKGGAVNRLVYSIGETIAGGVDEALLNELPEELADYFGEALYRMSIGLPADISIDDMLSNAWESSSEGFIMGLVYGSFDIPFSMRGHKDTALDLRRIANRNNSSWTDFIEALKDAGMDKPPENTSISSTDYDEAILKIYQASVKQRDEFLEDSYKDTVWESISIAKEELYSTVDSMGEEKAEVLPDGSIYRTDDDSLYFEESKEKDGSSRVFFGDKTNGAVYGYVEVASDGTKQTIRDVRVRLGYEGIRSEMVTDALAMTRSTETDVEWNPTTEGLLAVKENIVKSNPRGEEHGLNYELAGNKRDIDIKAQAQEIRSFNPSLTDQQAIVIARLNNIADDNGIISKANGGKLYEDIKNIPSELLKKHNVTPERINAATDYAKSLIYVGQKSNPSSFTHELFHVVSYLRPEESKQLSNAIRHTLADPDRKASLETFIDNNREIWQKAGDKSTTGEIMGRLGEIAEDATRWRAGIEEDLARLWEAYQGSGNSVKNNMPKELRNLFEKLSRYIRQVYATLKDNVPLDSEIAKAYDQLMGIEDGKLEEHSRNNASVERLEATEPEGDFRNADLQFLQNKAGKENSSVRLKYADTANPYTIKQEVFSRLLDSNAEAYIPIEFNKSNWQALFGEEQILDSVLGKVKLSEHQYQKFIARQRKGFLGMLKPTLENPTFILKEEGSENKNFIKVFNTDRGKKWFYSVTIRRDDLDIVISARPTHQKQVINKLNNSSLAYVASDIQKGVESELHQETTAALTDNHKINSDFVNKKIDEVNLLFQEAPDGASIQSGDTSIEKHNGTLVLTHSLEATRLADIEAIGGMPMPSLAITTPELQYKLNGYGEITLIGDRKLAERIIASGAVYDRDMWSPMVPEKLYKINEAGLARYIDRLHQDAPDEFFKPKLYSIDNHYKATPESLAQAYRKDLSLYIGYAKDNGIELPPYPTYKGKYPRYLAKKISDYFKEKGKDIDPYLITGYNASLSKGDFFGYIEDELYRYIDKVGLKNARERTRLSNMSYWVHGMNRGAVFKLFFDSDSLLKELILDAKSQLTKTIDTARLDEWKASIASEEEAVEWFEKKIAPYYSEPYVKVKRKHLPYTAENILESMQQEDIKGNALNFFSHSLSSAIGAGARNLKTREEIAESEDKLGIRRLKYYSTEDDLFDHVKDVIGLTNIDISEKFPESLADYFMKTDVKNRSRMRKSLRKYVYEGTSLEQADRIADIAETLRESKRSYFEAKPQEVLQLSDFKAAIVPDGISLTDRAILLRNGLEIIEYGYSNKDSVIDGYIESSTDLLFQENSNKDGAVEAELMDLYDSITDEESAMEIEEALSAYTPEDPAFASEQYDYEMPDDFDPNIYYGEEIKDQIDYESMLAEESARTSAELMENNRTDEELDKNPASLEGEGDPAYRLRSIITDAENTGMEFSEFAKSNAPQVVFEGTEAQKDDQFRKAMDDPMKLRQYLGIIGGAIYHDTPSLNAYYRQEMNKKWHRMENVKYIDPYIDQEYREGLKDRILKQVQNNDIRKAAKYAIEWKDYPKTTNLEAKARKEFKENARFYRNILARLIGDKDMLPETLVEYGSRLDIPNRDALDLMSVSELAEIARRASQADVLERLQKGTLKFGNDIDEKNAKAIKEAIKQQQKTIEENSKSIESLEKANASLQEGLDKANEALSHRDEAIENAASLLESLKRTLSGNKDSGLKTPAAERYSKLYAIYHNLMEEKEYQKQATAKGSRDKGKYYGAKFGTQNYMRDMKAMYPKLFESKIDGRDLFWETTNRATKDNAEIRENIEAEKARLKSEMRSLRVNMLNSAVRAIMLNSKDLNKALDMISSSLDGKVATKQELDSYAKQINDLKSKNEADISKLKATIGELRERLSNAEDMGKEELENTILEERWKAAKKLNDTKNTYESKLEQQKSYDDYMKNKAVQELKEKNAVDVENTILEERWKAAKQLKNLRESLAEYKKSTKKLENDLVRTKTRIESLKEKHQENIKRIREDIKEQRRKQKELQRIREEKQRIANAIMRPVNLNIVDYDTSAEAIAAIQALIDPNFRRDWVYDIKLDPQQETGYATMTIEEAKQYFNSIDEATRIDLMSYLSPELIERLTEQKKPLNDWTVQELMQLAGQVESLKERGKMVLSAKREAERARNNSIKKSIIDAIKAREGKRFGHKKADSLPGSIDRMSERRSLYYRFHSMNYNTRRMQELAQLLDGGYGMKGPAYKLLVDDKRYHQNRELSAIKKRSQAVEQFLTRQNMNEMAKNVMVDLGDGLQQRFTIDELAYAYLSQFDESNRAAVAYGALLSEEEKGTKLGVEQDPSTGLDTNIFLSDSENLIADDETLKETGDNRYKRLLAVATKELEQRNLMELVRAIQADFNNADNKKRLNRACIEAYNRPLDAREYYLAIHRIDSNKNALNENEPARIFDSGTNSIIKNPDKGFTISRIEISPRHQGNVDMSLLNVWNSSVKAQEHLIENAAYIKQLHSVFFFDQSKELARTIDVGYGSSLRNEITRYIDLVADPDRRTPAEGYDKAFRWLRGKTGPAYLGWKLAGMVLQGITSPMPGLSELGPARLAGAYLQLARHPKSIIDMINSKSVFMENRTMNPIIAESIQRTSQWDANKYQKAMNWMEEKGQIGLELVDRYAVAGNWLAMYNKALEENLDKGMDTALAEGAAIKTADDFILRTQPVGDPTELASLFRSNNELMKIFLQFQTSLNVIYNNITADSVGFVRNKEWRKLAGTMIGYGLAGVMLGLVQEGFDDDDDGKDRVLKLMYWALTQGVSSIPVFGQEIQNLAQKLLTGEGTWTSGSLFPGIDKLEQAIWAGSRGNWGKAIGKTAEGLGLYLGIPTSAIKQAISAAQGDLGALVGR